MTTLNLVAGEHHWNHLLQEVIHHQLQLSLSTHPTTVEWILWLDRKTGKLNLLDLLPHFTELAKEGRLYFEL